MNIHPPVDTPRVTVTDIQAKIADTKYVHDGVLTICILTLKNGFKEVGTSACAHPDLYNQALGEQIAYEDAFKKLWKPLGYELKERLYRDGE